MAIKERDSVTMTMDTDISEAAITDAIGCMGIPISTGTHLFAISINNYWLYEAHVIATEMNKSVNNVLFRAEPHPEAENDEWLLKHIETRKTFYSPGA